MSRLTQLLVVDTDRTALERLVYGFEREGCATAGTSDLEAAGDLYRATDSQLALVAVREPREGALRVIEKFRATRAPVLAYAPAAQRAEVAKIAGVDVLELPVYVRDLITVSRMLIAEKPCSEQETGFDGSLSGFGIFFIVRAMAAMRRSGVLTLERGQRRAELRFADGELTSAQVGSLQGFAAFHQLLLWEEAALSMRFRAVVRRGQFPPQAEEIVRDGERFLRDFAHAAEGVGPVSTLLVQDVPKLSSLATQMPEEVMPVVRLCDGQRTMGDVVEDSPFRAFDTIRILGRLIDMGVVVRKDPSADDKRPSLDAWLAKPATPATSTTSTTKAATPAPVLKPAVPAAAPRVTSGSLDVRAAAAAPKSSPGPAQPSIIIEGLTPEPARGPKETAPLPQLAPATPAPRPRAPTPAPVNVAPATVTPAPRPRAPTPAPVNVAPATVAPATSSSSIQIDPVLLAEMEAAEAAERAAASAPKTPLPAPVSMVPTAAPPLTASAPPAPAPVVLVPKQAPAAPTAPVVQAPPIAARPTPAAPTPAVASTNNKKGRPATGKTRVTPSSAFDALETEFFAREADLYKQETVDNFDDLDQGGSPTGAPRRSAPPAARPSGGGNGKRKR